MTELEPRAGEALERTLDRYTRVRLDPSPAQVRRARGAVMEAAWRQRLAEPAPLAAVPTASAPARRGLFAGWGARRLGASLAAAVLAGLLVGSTAFAGTRAGAPLYDLRIAFEELTLPTDPQARLEAEIAQAQTRLSEIVDAVAKDDAGAVAAAVRAYESSLDDLDEATGGPAERALEAVTNHRDVLLGVLARAPENAVDGLENALARSSVVIDRLGADAAPGTSGGAGNGNGNGNGSGNANGNGNGAGTGSGTGNGTGSGANNGGNGQGPDGNNGNGAGGNGNPGAKPSKEPVAPATPAPAEDPTKELKTPKPGGGKP